MCERTRAHLPTQDPSLLPRISPKFKCCRDSRFVTLTHAFLGEVDMMHRIKEAMTKVPTKKVLVFLGEIFFG